MDNSINIKKVQKVLLEMGKVISEILEKHSIPYMIAYGTLLGAVRHKGFIPWDDDFDLYLFDDTYDEAIELLRKELPGNMFLEDAKSEPLFFHGWARVKDLYSVVGYSHYAQDSCYEHKGLCADLFRTKKMMLSELESYLNTENLNYLLRRKNNNLIEYDEYQKRMSLLKEKMENAHRFAGDDIEVYNLLPIYKCHFMKADNVFPLKRYAFDKYEFWGPNNPEKILTDIYGEYMRLPPIEQRKSHYSAVDFID